jgi:hypothetical protein
MSPSRDIDNKPTLPNWPQFATSSRKHRGVAYRPWAFTEHGALMAANILRSERALEMSLYVTRPTKSAFIRVNQRLALCAIANEQ